MTKEELITKWQKEAEEINKKSKEPEETECAKIAHIYIADRLLRCIKDLKQLNEEVYKDSDKKVCLKPYRCKYKDTWNKCTLNTKCGIAAIGWWYELKPI